jgi:hypothetical protein
VLDTRTRRWRSESNLGKPSGLLDWEALCELQQALLDHPRRSSCRRRRFSGSS